MLHRRMVITITRRSIQPKIIPEKEEESASAYPESAASTSVNVHWNHAMRVFHKNYNTKNLSVKP